VPDVVPLALPAVPTADPRWIMVESEFATAREHEIESLFALGNGYVGTRGSLAEGSPLSDPATFVAGVFRSAPGWNAVRELARGVEWVRLRASLDGRSLTMDPRARLDHRRVLDLRQAILWREWRHRDLAGRTTRVHGLRLASLADRHVLLQSVTLTPENYAGRLTIEAVIESAAGTEIGRGLPVTLARTPEGSGVRVAFAVATRLWLPGGGTLAQEVDSVPEGAVERWAVDLDVGATYRLDRIVAVYTSREARDPVAAAREHATRVAAAGADAAVAAHVGAWAARWDASDVAVDGDLQATRALRFAVYHLVSAANPDDEHVSIGARLLTGESYKGHVFWDTEIFMLPFFTLTHPRAARALLMYRFHTLDAARAKAARLGFRGALYAWESADTGEEVTPPFTVFPDGRIERVLAGEQEHHVSADVAYAVWRYWQATADEAFLLDAGAPILVETARFWASRVEPGVDGRYHIRGVIGPDEYHVGVDDDAYTNVMAQWTLERGAETAALLAARWPARWATLAERLAVAGDEPRTWARIAAAMYTGFDPQTGLFEQFRGYFALEDVDQRAYEPRTAPLEVLLGPARLQGSKLLKQADVVMLLHLLWDRFPPDVRAANFRYYEPRTSHGSSLSPAIHAAVAARLGDVPRAEAYFRRAADIDLANNMGNAAGGVHGGALGGLWQAAVIGFGGLTILNDAGPVFRPHLPAHWDRLRFALAWRGRRVVVDARPGTPVDVGGGAEARA